jgi:GT2 family glycosyltransferase
MTEEQTQLDLSTVIVSFNTRDILRRCLNALACHAGDLRHEVIVVDNDSRDGSPEMVTREFPRVRLIRNAQNLMFARGSNQGMKAARGRNLLLLNSDAFVRADAVQTMVRFLDRTPRAAAVGPKVLNVDGSLQSKGYTAPRIGLGLVRVTGLNKLLPDRVKHRVFASYFWDENKAVMPDVLSGCCVMLRASVVREIGALCEDFYHGGEDGEWCFRARRFGYQVWFFPEAVVEHIGGASKVHLDSTVTIRDSVRMWELSFGVGYGLVAEALDIAYDLQRYLSALLTGKDSALRGQIRAEVRLDARKIAALISHGLRGPRRPGVSSSR